MLPLLLTLFASVAPERLILAFDLDREVVSATQALCALTKAV